MAGRTVGRVVGRWIGRLVARSLGRSIGWTVIPSLGRTGLAGRRAKEREREGGGFFETSGRRTS